jgi:hypothetical protein
MKETLVLGKCQAMAILAAPLEHRTRTSNQYTKLVAVETAVSRMPANTSLALIRSLR